MKSLINNKTNQSLPDSFLHNGVEIRNPTLIAEKFNHYFTNIGTSLASTIPIASVSHSSYLLGSYMNSFVIEATDMHEIVEVTGELKNKQSAGYDDISLAIVKSSIHYIAEPLSKIINCSFSCGIVPDALKIATICYIFKDGIVKVLTTIDQFQFCPVSLKLLKN